MSKEKRWSRIIETCRSQKTASVEELTSILNVSPATIRRDLQDMEDLNLITRFHGGCRISTSQFDEPGMIVKNESNSTAKRRIALTAAKQVHDNMMIFIDAGSSTYDMLEYLNARNITVVTCGVPHLAVLARKRISTIVLGGTLRPSTEAICGKTTLAQLEDMYFDMAFLGVNGIHERLGLTTSNELEAAVKASVISRSQTSYVLADSSKYNCLFPEAFASFDEVTLISDQLPKFTSKVRCICTDGTKNF